MRFELYEKNNKYYSVLLGDSGDPAFASKLKNSIKPMIMQEFTNEPGLDQKELDYILEYTLSAMIGIMSYWFRQTDKLPNGKLHELINKLMEQGVIPDLPDTVESIRKRLFRVCITDSNHNLPKAPNVLVGSRYLQSTSSCN